MGPELDWILTSGQKVQPTFTSGAGFRSGLHPPPPQWYKLWHKWDWSQSQWILNSGQKVWPKYGSQAGSTSRVYPTKSDFIFGILMMIIALNGSSCKKYIISSIDTYILHTHEKSYIKWSSL